MGSTRRGGRASTLLTFALSAMLACAGVPLGPCQAQAAETTVENPEYAEALERLDSITAEYDELSAQQDATLSQLEDVRSQIADNESQIEVVQQDIDESRANLARQQEFLAGHISTDYKTGGVSLLSIVLSATSFEDAVSKIYYYDSVCASEVEAIEAINTTKAQLQSQQDELKRLEDDLLAQQESIEGLYEQQRQQAEEIHAQQVEAAELLTSLPREIVVTIADDPEELVGVSELVLESNQEEQAEQGTSQQATQQEQQATRQQSNTSADTTTTTTPAETPAEPTSGGALQSLIDTAYSTGPTRSDWGCAGWVYIVFKNAGVYSKAPSCAAWYYENWCYSSDRSELRPGMVIAVNNTGGSAAGRRYGHVCIYMGNNTVRHFTQGAVSDMSLDTWISKYGRVCTPRWGWNGGIVLS